ncbi:cytochrome P450 [Actinomadura sp. 6N118]|uniref:cytochrome P450 n=1 Tax=Actinomadura sp. 6N118 TaxID=3375151 RepID=UPI0037A4FF0E
MTEATAEAPRIPMRRDCPYHPPAPYARLREQGPLARVTLADGRTAWLVTGYAEVRMLLADRRMSADPTTPGYPELDNVPDELRSSPEDFRETQTFVQMDMPAQGLHRRMVLSHFGARRVAALRPVVQEAADALVDRMLHVGPPADLVPAFAAPLPAAVLTEMLGVPATDREAFRTRLAQGERGIAGLAPSLDGLIRSDPKEGIIGTLAARVRGGELTHRQALATTMMLLVAGHETTENMIALGALALLRHPGQLEAVRDDPSLMPGAVEELLRYVSTADVLPRVATAEIDVAGMRIAPGTPVILSLAAANRDGGVFAVPDTVDVLRDERGVSRDERGVSRGGRHVAFGHGPHQCLGNNLARLELTVALSTLFRRVPTLRLAVPATDLDVKPALSLQGVTGLPVDWGVCRPLTGSPPNEKGHG